MGLHPVLGLATAAALAAAQPAPAETQPASRPATDVAGAFTRVERPGGGPGHYKLAIGADADTEFPDFAVDQGYSRTKVIMKSAFIGDPGDTGEIGFLAVGGDPRHPQAWTQPSPGFFIYSLPMDTSGKLAIDRQRLGLPARASTYNGRNGQIYIGSTEVPTPSARGGAVVFGATPKGGVVPVDRAWVRDLGLVLPGRSALEESGVAYPYIAHAFKNLYAPGPVNWADVGGWGNLSIIASDRATGAAAIAIRRSDDLGTGFDWMYDKASGELQLDSVAGDQRRPALAVTPTGDLAPAAPSVGLGRPNRPFAQVAARRLVVAQPVVPASSSAPCAAGQISWDDGHVYVCVSRDHWKRTALADW